jgi:hypothetical protein
MAAKGLNEDVTFALVPLTCFVGLSEGGLASSGMDLKLLVTVSDAVGADYRTNSLLWQLFRI